MAYLSIKNLSFAYPNSKKNMLNNLSLEIEEGTLNLIIGKSGCGKTTLLKLIKTTLAPKGNRTGTIELNNCNIDSLSNEKNASTIGFLMQNPDHQIVTDRVWHELSFGLENLGYDNGYIRKRIGEVSAYLGISNLLNSKTNELSGGQKQLVNLASIMALSPSLLLLDEPTSQLDPIASQEFIGIIKKLNQELGLTIVIIEQNPQEIMSECDKVFLLDKGKIDYCATPQDMASYLIENNMPLLHSLPSPALILKPICDKSIVLSVKDGRKKLNTYINTIADNLLFKSNQVSCSQDKNSILVEKINNNDILIKNTNDCKNSILIKKSLSNATYYIQPNICFDNNAIKIEKLVKNSILVEKNRKNNNFALVAKNLSFCYNKQTAPVINNLSIKASYGQILGIIGDNGSGKSTLLKVLCGVYKPYKGSIDIYNKNGEKIKGKNKPPISYLVQNPDLLFSFPTVKDELWQMKNFSNIATDTINSTIELLQLNDLLNTHPFDLSGGEKQKLALAKMLLLSPQILLLDEPTKGLDCDSKLHFQSIIQSLRHQGMCIIIVSHDLDFCASNCDLCSYMLGGELDNFLPPNKLFEDNIYYTTQTARMCRNYISNTVTTEQAIDIIDRLNSLSK